MSRQTITITMSRWESEEEVYMAKKDDNNKKQTNKGKKQAAQKTAKPGKIAMDWLRRRMKKQPYAGTHGYTEEEVNEIIRDKKRKK